VAPRVGITWAPFASGRTTIRSSWGLFYDWLPLNTYEQTLRVDGVQHATYSGTLTSKFFGQPTNVSGMRKVDVGMTLGF